MKSSITPFVVFALALAVALGGCKGRETAAGNQSTATIAPAKAQPDPTGTDAMTQTVDIENGRTDAEGETGTAPNDTTYLGSDGATTMTGTTTSGSPAPASTTTR